MGLSEWNVPSISIAELQEGGEEMRISVGNSRHLYDRELFILAFTCQMTRGVFR